MSAKKDRYGGGAGAHKPGGADGGKSGGASARPASGSVGRGGPGAGPGAGRYNGTSGNVVHIQSPNGRSVDFTYNAAGFVCSIIDNIGRRYSYNYDSTGRLTSIVNPQSGTRQYTWDTTNNRITDIHDARGGLVVHNQHDSLGHVSHQDLADGSSYNYAYTLSSCLNPPGTCVPAVTQTDLTDRRGTVRRVQFDAQGRVVEDAPAHHDGRPSSGRLCGFVPGELGLRWVARGREGDPQTEMHVPS